VTLCQTLVDCLSYVRKGITIFWNAGSHSTINTMSHPRRSEALGHIYSIVEGIPILWFITMKRMLFLMCMHSWPETCGYPHQAVHAQLTWDVWLSPSGCACTADLRRVAIPIRLCMHSWPETCGRPHQADSSASFKLIFFKLFQPNTVLANIFEGHKPKLWIIFGEILLCSENLNSLAPIKGWCPW
jgi:hypothetical protein